MGASQCGGDRLTLLAIDDQIERLGSSLKDDQQRGRREEMGLVTLFPNAPVE
jgi:hypothetical protein